ncbi:MAG: SDR family oxidoreductase [Nitriliruptorales bacterium]
MPVLVTAPEGEVGSDLLRRLAATGGQIRAFCGAEAPIAQFRQLGVVCAAGSLLDEGHLETAMEQVHTVVHLGVSPLAPDPAGLVKETATVVTAAVGAGVKRFVTLSLPGADHAAVDPLRDAAAEVEEMAAAMPCPSVVVRPSLVDTGTLREVLARTALASEVLDTPVAPVRPADLASLLFQLDEQRDVELGDHEVLAADGPRVASLREYLRAVGVTPLSLVGRVVERLRPSGAGSLLPDVLVGAWTSPAEVVDGWEFTAVTPASPLDAAPG